MNSMTKLNYQTKPTLTQTKELKKAWKEVKKIQQDYWEQISLLEMRIERATGIKNIEIFHVDNGPVGIGTTDRTIALIHDRELE
jgi:hypothetical protein